MSQNPPGSGSFTEYILSPDWSNTVIAVLAFLFSVFTYINQKNKDREASTIQQAKDIQAMENAERLRQHTIRLEWYKEAVRTKLGDVYNSFENMHQLRNSLYGSVLSEATIDDVVPAYKKILYSLRMSALEPILFIHQPTYAKLKDQLDGLLEAITNAVVNEELKLVEQDIYEREIGKKINEY